MQTRRYFLSLTLGGLAGIIKVPEVLAQKVTKDLKPEDLSDVESGISAEYKMDLLKWAYDVILNNSKIQEQIKHAQVLPVSTSEEPGEFGELVFDKENNLPENIQVVKNAGEKVVFQIGRTLPDDKFKLEEDEVILSVVTIIDNQFYNRYNRRSIEVGQIGEINIEMIVFNCKTKKIKKLLEEKKDL
jgi:hypothetical protein